MTRKDYEAIASEIRQAIMMETPNNYDATMGWRSAGWHLTHRLGAIFAKDNPRFDMAKWEKACNPFA